MARVEFEVARQVTTNYLWNNRRHHLHPQTLPEVQGLLSGTRSYRDVIPGLDKVETDLGLTTKEITNALSSPCFRADFPDLFPMSDHFSLIDNALLPPLPQGRLENMLYNESYVKGSTILAAMNAQLATKAGRARVIHTPVRATR